MIIQIRAEFSCDECGKAFSVKVEPSMQVDDIAVEALMNSLEYKEGTKFVKGCSSYQNYKHLCGDCTAVEDKK